MQKKLSLPDENVGKLIDITISDEVKQSYLEYAMSVIVSRALPDVRDGLKPVHRRILYAMWSIGLKHSGRFRKSAHVVGEVMAKYHPHGDAAIYDSMVRMAQDFSMRHPFVNGQGNFGSIDGDPAAAMRYTEARLHTLAEEMLTDIEKETVNFTDTYDGSNKEPTVLPSKVPNLLLNGTTGIAVGMATNIPPHNLGELCDGVMLLIDQPKTTIEELSEIIKGPDFPTGGIIYNKKDIAIAYATGKGGMVVRAKTEITEDSRGMFRIIVQEIPYQINKSNLLEKIANLVQEKKIDGIRDLRDESNKDGIRVVIELKKDAYPKKVLNRLYKLTELQTTYHANMLALVDGIQPKVLNLKIILEEFIKHRQEIVRKRALFELKKAENRAHILEGLKMALDKIDQVIKTIRASKDKDEAKTNLIKQFKFTDLQATAILEMKLQQLANLERKKVEDELAEKQALIKKLKTLLASETKILEVIHTETQEIKEKYSNPRRTEIVAHGIKEFKMEDLVPNENTIIMMTEDGYIKRLPPDTFKSQSRGGKGIIGTTTKEEDRVEKIEVTNTHDNIMFFTNRGRVFQLFAYDIPQASRTAKGQAMVNFLQLMPNEKVATFIALGNLNEEKYLVMVTKKGLIKKTTIDAFSSVRKTGLIALKLKTDDSMEWVGASTGKNQISIITKNGQAIRFEEDDVRAMGRTASGVRGIRLKGDDEVISMDIVDPTNKNLALFNIGANGLGKRTELSKYKVQGRGGSGIKTAEVTDKTGYLVHAEIIDNTQAKDMDLIIMSHKGQTIRMPLASVSLSGRATQGVRLMRFKATDDHVAGVTILDNIEEKEE